MTISKTLIVILILSISINLNAQINGYTAMGEPIILYTNGTWKYVRLDTVSNELKDVTRLVDSITNELITQTGLIGKWKATSLKMTDKKSSKIIQIDLKNPLSIKYFTDTFWYDGLYGKIKLEKGKDAEKAIKETAPFFEGLGSTYLVLDRDSSFVLDNQPTLFGIAVNSKMQNKIKNKWHSYAEEKILELKVSNAESRRYKIVKQSLTTFVIDEEWRDVNDFPIKEITMTKQ